MDDQFRIFLFPQKPAIRDSFSIGRLKSSVVKLGINIDLSLFVNNLPNLDNYFDKEYGIVFDLPLAFLEVILKN